MGTVFTSDRLARPSHPLGLAGLLLVLGGCSGFLFQPVKTLVRSPGDVGIAYDDVELIAADGTVLHGWWFDSKTEPKGTVYFLHGNAENISTHMASVWWLPASGYQVLLLDYRGYGRSQGAPSLPDVFLDIEAGFDWLARRPDARRLPVFLFGQSLGAAMSTYVMASNPDTLAQLDGVILESGFTRYRTITRELTSRYWLTWPIQWPAAWSMPRRYDPIDHIGAISPVPLLLIHGTEDTVVPFNHAEELLAAAGQPRWLLKYDGPHIGAMLDPALREVMLDFLAGRTPTLDESPVRASARTREPVTANTPNPDNGGGIE